MNTFQLGLIGLGTMGRNMLLNMADHGFRVAGHDQSAEAVGSLADEAQSDAVFATQDIGKFVSVLEHPRQIMLLVPAGKVVDLVIEELLPLLDKGDIIIDGGNSHFTDTDKRQRSLEGAGITFVGMGVSGGAEGARLGPSMMPGGSEEGWKAIKPIFEAASAKVNGEPCVTYLGPGAAGHYVKMVHNGIEYGMMQLIAEAYDYMKRGLLMSNEQMGEVLTQWNEGKLDSFLIEITSHIFQTTDKLEGGLLIDHILDQSKSKGTGKWTCQDAMDIQAPVPVIDLAVAMRDLSKYKAERTDASSILSGPGETMASLERKHDISFLEDALYFALLVTYAQGMFQLHLARKAHGYDYNLRDIAAIWRGGCIIRSKILVQIMAAYDRKSSLTNLLLDHSIAEELKCESNTRIVLKHAIDHGIPMPCLMASLSYYDAFRSEHLPANLIQAQRDYFGSHSFERIDRPGTFHADWYQG